MAVISDHADMVSVLSLTIRKFLRLLIDFKDLSGKTVLGYVYVKTNKFVKLFYCNLFMRDPGRILKQKIENIVTLSL